MKKNYLAPETVELKMVTNRMVATSIPVVGSDVDTNNPDIQLENGRRGEWGNLWK